MIKNYSDIPVLVSVKSDAGSSGMAYFLVALLAMCVGTASLLIGIPIYYRHAISPNELGLATIIILFALIIVLRMRKSSWFDDYWETSPGGIVAEGLFRCVKIPWPQVIKAETRWLGPILGRAHLIRTEKVVIAIPESDPYLSASIWQHLKTYGMANNILLNEQACSFWQKIPDDIPNEIEWKNIVRQGILKSTIYISVSDNHLEVKNPRVDISVGWDEIESAVWKGSTLRLETSSGRCILIPWITNDEESGRLMLAIIRRLRSCKKPVQLPIPYYMME